MKSSRTFAAVCCFHLVEVGVDGDHGGELDHAGLAAVGRVAYEAVADQAHACTVRAASYVTPWSYHGDVDICKARPSSLILLQQVGREEENTQKWMLTTLF